MGFGEKVFRVFNYTIENEMEKNKAGLCAG